MALVVDNFAGGGGASVGIERALGQPVTVAINHDAQAVAMHRANHPDTHHLCEDLLDVDPRTVRPGEQIDLAWFSPDCTHHSKARGGKPVDKNIRGLAWVVIRWAAVRRPRVIMLENVEEFQDWGPLTPDDKPCKQRRGLTFRRWMRELHKLGYETELRELRACDYGTPTIRKRLFIVARCDGLPIVWPKATHGPGLKPYRAAAECIDWSGFERKRPLAENTMRRIARGVQRFVLESPAPFIVRIGQTGGGGSYSYGTDEPLTTVTTKAEHLLCAPYFVPRHGERPPNWRCRHCKTEFDVEPTCGCTACGSDDDLVLISGQTSRTRSVDQPIPTITATANGASLVSAFLSKYHGLKGGESRGRDPGEPVGTLDTSNRYSVVAANLAKHYGGHETPGAALGDPLSTVTAKDHHAVVASHLINLKGNDRRMRELSEPAPTICGGGNHAGLVAALMAPYYGSGSGETGRDLFDPAPTVTSKDRLQLVTVTIDGETYLLTDIGMRMLQPRELFLAQGFPADYRIDIEVDGKRLSKAAQVRMCGNSVCPDVVEALVRANVSLAGEKPGRAAA